MQDPFDRAPRLLFSPGIAQTPCPMQATSASRALRALDELLARAVERAFSDGFTEFLRGAAR